MKFNNILLIDFEENDLDNFAWKRVKELSNSIEILPREKISTKQFKDTDCLLVKLGATVNKDLIDKIPKLQYIGMFGTGYGRIDTMYAKSKNIAVTNIADYATEGVAEFTFAILLEYLRDIAKAKQKGKNEDYSDKGFYGNEIKGKKFGVVGLGHIGLRTAEIAQAFGADVLYWSEHRKKDAEKMGIDYSNDILKNADIITINLALNSSTENYINAERIAEIKKGAIIINPSPMELFDFDALVKRLEMNDITLIIDHADELVAKNAKLLSKYGNCIMYPPIAYLTREATQKKLSIFATNIENFLKGSPTNKVN